MVRIGRRRLDSTLKGQDSLEGGCSAETGVMGVPWMGTLVRPLIGSYQYWRYVIRLDGGVLWKIKATLDKVWHKIYRHH